MKISDGGLHGYHWLIAVILGFTTWIASALFKLLPESIFPDFGKQSESEDEKNAEGGLEKKNSSLKRGGSGLMKGHMRGSFRNHSKQGSLRNQNSVDRAGSHQRKQQSGTNLAPVDKDYK